MTRRGPLAGLQVIDLSTTLPSSFATMVFADYGADVIQIEPPGGSTLRHRSGWPFWFRGKKSLEVDLRDGSGVAMVQDLLRTADVAVEAFRPGVTERLGIGYETSAETNERLVYTSITGFGRRGPHVGLKGYDSIVQAKIGSFGRSPSGRPGPAMAPHPSATFGAGLLAMYGTLIALFDRERSGHGQRVDVNLVQGIAGQDPWSWVLRFLAQRYPDAFVEADKGIDMDGVPTTWLIFSVMAALSKDGRWLQFAHATPKQFEAFLDSLGLGWIRSDPDLKNSPDALDTETRERFWELALAAVRSKTVEEWQAIFDSDTDLFAELFRSGIEPLDHPQMLHNDDVLEVDIESVGRVREPNVLVKMSATPGCGLGAVPGLGEHRSEIDAQLSSTGRQRPSQSSDQGSHQDYFRGNFQLPPGSAGDLHPARASNPEASSKTVSDAPPLQGITVLELGTFYAAPFGAAMLADMGARVIKVESLSGDQIRFVLPMPEAGGVRVTQGKEAIAVDFTTPEGKTIIYDLVRKADVLLQSFRGGVAKRLGYDHETLLKINPDLVYHYGQGYGVTGPYAHRPAYNAVIAAASGFARRIVPNVPERTDLSLREVKRWAVSNRGLGSGGPDGYGAFGVAVAMALGLLVRQRNGQGQWTMTSMLATMAHVMSDTVVDYPGRPTLDAVDEQGLGYNALHRLYETERGWFVLCVFTDTEWADLVRALEPEVDLRGDNRFVTGDQRTKNDATLADVLEQIFCRRSAAEWESALSAADVACAEVHPAASHSIMDEGALAEQLGLTTVVEHPLFGSHIRMTALASLSRSRTVLRPGCTVGQHTDAILRELGYTSEEIISLRQAKVVGG